MELSVLKFDFFKILTDHECFIPINLPLPYELQPADISFEAMSEKHPQSAMLIQEMVRSLSGGETVKLARAIAICTLNMLLTKHDFDARYQEPGQRARVALVYFPLVPLLLDAYGDMEPWHKESPPIEKRGLYVSLLFVLRNIDRAFLRRWWRLESVERRHRFLDLLAACAATFEYDRANAKGAILQAPSFAFATSEKKAPESPRKSSLGDSDADKSQEPGKEGKLNCCVMMLLLDVVEDFVEDFAPEMATPDGTPTLERVLALLVNLLERPQSLRFLESLFASLRAFLSRFRSRLFSENSSVLYALCREVLRYANTASAHTRALATSLLFLLMLRNYEEMGQFGRIYTQATTALSQLITEGAMSDDTYIRHAFNSLTEYALFVYSTATIAIIPAERARNEARHCYLKAGFARQVQELSGTLTKILRDTIEVTELKQKADSEMMAELYFRIAQGYVHTPDLREELNPIEVSIEEIDKRVQALVCELEQKPPNIKTLQHVLQGSALPQVNQGATEICEVFLAKGEGDKYSPASLERLRESLRQFLKACERAIELNRSLIGSEQLQFQKSIEEGFRDIKTQMAPHVQARDPKRVMSFGIMQESNGSDEDSDDSESEYTIGFLKACERAIELNRSLIGSEQLQFQKSIEEGFRDIKTQMAPHVQARDPKRVMSFGIMQESNGSDDDSDDSESEYTIGSPPTSGPPSQIGSPRT
ncbi:dedicator of cytokinesis 6, putative [Acanthamoeba castellanii str. Neff]|uniref:Dedicator of cytokinesis 6, putative n=1 Tax=Acanthamoeba castellanii (strain ATCC 30010 / Neff) TaxID=1257118 RepID=L8GPU7_ACACF|nr:dedicator of cytokinesis 6, putative [Acanthamoeba castellanii str. Neff]ELR14947.1 dedicator of cytokinesis 6, putative [Acanthamoeba castellanii str. Neff]